MSDRGPNEIERRPDWAALSIAAFLIVIAGVITWDMMRLPSPGRYDPLGASGFPYMVAGGLVILAVGLVWDAVRGNFPARERLDFLPVLFVIGGLVLQMALLKPLGFSVATGLMFAAVAHGFGEKRVFISVPAGLILSAFVWAIFARLLKLTLPEGPPEYWMIAMINRFRRWQLMETFGLLLQGLAVATQPMNLIYALIGVTLGTAVGVLPGIGPALTVALLLPVTYKLDPGGSLIMFAGIYYGGMYGGSTTSILLNTPGESSSIVTAIEGNKMARKGRGGPALATAAIGSFVAGLIATLALAFLAPWVVKLALVFGQREYFALMVLAFVTVSATFGSSVIRGLTSLALGLTIGLIGIDTQTGQARLAFGIPDLLDKIDVTTVAVAMFAMGEALYLAAQGKRVQETVETVRGSLWMTASDWGRSWKAWLRGTLIGFPIGAMPAGGAEIGTFLSYATERRLSKHKEEFGEGAIEGVAGPEAANNASAAGTLVPLLTLGLPTTATAAIMLAGFQQYGLQPGPQLFTSNPTLVWGLIASLLIANFMLVVLNLPLVGLWVKLLSIPRPWLYAGILLFATLGTLGSSPSVFELGVLLAFGLLGFGLRIFGFPIAPVIVGLILGPLAEANLRRTLSIGGWESFLQSGIAMVLFALAAIALILPVLVRARGKGKVLEQLAADED